MHGTVPSVFVTIHPYAVLRADDSESNLEMLVADLKMVARTLS